MIIPKEKFKESSPDDLFVKIAEAIILIRANGNVILVTNITSFIQSRLIKSSFSNTKIVATPGSTRNKRPNKLNKNDESFKFSLFKTSIIIFQFQQISTFSPIFSDKYFSTSVIPPISSIKWSDLAFSPRTEDPSAIFFTSPRGILRLIETASIKF